MYEVVTIHPKLTKMNVKNTEHALYIQKTTMTRKESHLGPSLLLRGKVPVHSCPHFEVQHAGLRVTCPKGGSIRFSHSTYCTSATPNGHLKVSVRTYCIYCTVYSIYN